MMSDAVGPVLRMSDLIPAITDAIRDDNPGKEIEVVDRGAYVRIQGPSPIRVTQGSIERHLGHGFEMRELEAIMSAFAGRIDTRSDEVRWYHAHQPAGAAERT
jgi:toluene monooxygenase system protein D